MKKLTTKKLSVAPKPNRFVIVVYSDTHINDAMGLLAPEIGMSWGGSYTANVPQAQWTWPKWLEFCELAKSIAARKPNTKFIAVGDGDLGELDLKRRSINVLSRNPNDILHMMTTTLSPLTSVVDRNYVIRGTEAHGGLSNWIEELFAGKIGAEPLKLTEAINKKDADGKEEPSNLQYARWDMLFDWGGVLVDISHHMRIAGREWSVGSPAVTVC